jgi:hypothetical protein
MKDAAWVVSLTLTSIAAWAATFAAAMVGGGPSFFIILGFGAIVVPFAMVYASTVSVPELSRWFCVCYSACPMLVGVVSLYQIGVGEWQASVFWFGAGVMACGMSVLGAFLGRRAAQRTPEWRIKRGLCPKCAYDLRGSTDATACPECGKPVRSNA